VELQNFLGLKGCLAKFNVAEREGSSSTVSDDGRGSGNAAATA